MYYSFLDPCALEVEIDAWAATLIAVDASLMDDVRYAMGMWWEFHEGASLFH